MLLMTGLFTVIGLFLNSLGAISMVAPDSEYLDEFFGRVFYRSQHCYDQFSRLEYDHVILIEENETIFPTFLISVFDLECKPSEINCLIKDNPGSDANLQICWDSENRTGAYSTSFERAKDKVETRKQRQYLHRGVVLLGVGFGFQIINIFI